MKDLIQRTRTFLTFDAPLEYDYIHTLFFTTHTERQQKIPTWSPTATRQKMIAEFWFSHVLVHFLAVIGLAVLLSWTMFSPFHSGYWLTVLLVALVSFPVLLIGNYSPSFLFCFLPNLETVVNRYRNVQQQLMIRRLREELKSQREAAEMRLAEQQVLFLKQQEIVQNRFQRKITLQKERMERQQEVIKKCRQAQLSNLALTLVYYVFVKAENGLVQSDDRTANLLLRLYGVDRGSLRANLELIAGSGSKRKNLGERKTTEIRNRFEEAREFLEEMGWSPKGASLLRDLEIKILG